MTREEFDEILEQTNAVICNREWYERAIKALEPCEDCVSREFMYKLGAKCIAVRNENDVLVAIASIESLPPVTPKPKTEWIPVSERVPEKGKQVLCCNKSGSVFTSAITYINSNGMVSFGQHYEVIAWMPLPEPYKTEKE